uniref:Uncharacterized protein n=1 Tax=Panagrolaimus sp. PS1159 TaxID=55785 RepID=A0AC35FS10_9BILA
MDESDKPATGYRDFWKEYLGVMEKTKKPPKLFNKFKWEDILAHLRLISHDMIDFEQFEEVAQVYCSMADIYAKLENPLNQRKYYLKAARTYYQLLKNRFEIRYSTHTDFGDSMEECFLKVIDLSINMNLIHFSGIIFAEMANCFISVQNYETAHRYFLKGARILQSDFFDEISIMKQMISNSSHFSDMNEPLSDIFSLWQPFCKKFPHKETEEGPNAPEKSEEKLREAMKSFEIDFILISLKRFLKHDELGKTILPDYDGNFRTNLRTSVLNKREFEEISKFIAAVKERNHFDAGAIYITELMMDIDELGRGLIKEILNMIEQRPIIGEPLKDIIEEEGLSARETMRKMFEFHTLNYREKAPKPEFAE